MAIPSDTEAPLVNTKIPAITPAQAASGACAAPMFIQPKAINCN